MAATSQAIVPLDKDTTDGLYDLVSMFSQMKISLVKNGSVDDSCDSDGDKDDEDVYINGEKVINYMTFHKYLPSILASLRRGNTITILDNRMRSTDLSVQKGESSLLPVPYKSDPLSRLCDENTVISYDDVNHIIKLWDLRKNYTNYHKQPYPRSTIYLSRHDVTRSTPSNVFKCDFKPNVDLDDIENDMPINSMQINTEVSKKYSLNYLLTWPESLPSVVVTYSDAQRARHSSVIIEELPDDREPSLGTKSEVLPLSNKQPIHKRKNLESMDDIYVSKKSIMTCTGCGKATSSATFCDTCNWTENKRKSSEELQRETKHICTPNGHNRANKPLCTVEINELKGKRKLQDDPIISPIIERKRPHIDTELVPREQETSIVKQNEATHISVKCDVGTCNNNSQGKLNHSKIINVPKGILDNVLLNSVFTTENLDWKSKLRIENCEPKTTKIPKLYV